MAAHDTLARARALRLASHDTNHARTRNSRHAREQTAHACVRGITLRARDAIDNSQKIAAAWVEKTDTHQEPTYYGDDEETTETISLYIMFEGDLRPTLLTNNTTRYSRKAEHPDFRLKRGNVSVTADSTRISPSFRRP